MLKRERGAESNGMLPNLFILKLQSRFLSLHWKTCLWAELQRWCPCDRFRSFKVCSDAKERVGLESNGMLPHQFIPSKTATYVPEFGMEDLPLGRIAALVPEFAVKNLPLGRTLMMM